MEMILYAENDDTVPVIACSLAGAEHAERLERWHSLLATADVTRTGLSATATVASDRCLPLVTLLRDEQRCCPFLDFRLDFHGNTVQLTVSAPNVMAEPFLDALLPRAPGQ